jgi:hypothetical protein
LFYVSIIHPQVIDIFFQILRGLDTIEDDMSINIATKAPLLEGFHQKLHQRGWNFTESGPNEKDRQLLVEFDVVCHNLPIFFYFFFLFTTLLLLFYFVSDPIMFLRHQAAR